jgi:hypothetical protein
MARIEGLGQDSKDFIREKLGFLVISDEQWIALWPLFVKELNKVRKGDLADRLNHLVKIYDIEGIRRIRAVRGTLKIIVACPCGRCDDEKAVTPERVGGKILLPVRHLCEESSNGRAGVSVNRVRNRGQD